MTSSADASKPSYDSCIWTWYDWPALDSDTLYAALKLRSDIFVVEQNCVFSDMDGLDPRCEHLCCKDASGTLLGYLRLLPPGVKYAEPALGRLVVKSVARKSGLARVTLFEGIERCNALYPRHPIFLSAQQYLEKFYQSMGFETVSSPYLDDGIMHIDMRRASR